MKIPKSRVRASLRIFNFFEIRQDPMIYPILEIRNISFMIKIAIFWPKLDRNKKFCKILTQLDGN